MTPLLEAAVAARQAGLDVPKCVRCARNEVLAAGPREPAPWMCNYCGDTDINPDPARLGWAAEGWLLAREHYPVIHAYPVSTRFVNYTEAGDMLELDQAHDKTSEGRTTALLRLVARVGGKQ